MTIFSTFTWIEIIGYLITLLTAGIAFYGAISSNRDQDAKYYKVLSGILVVLGVILTILLSIRYEYINNITLLKEESTIKTIENIKKAHEKISSVDNHFYREVFQERQSAFDKTLANLTSGKLTLTPLELANQAVKLFQNEKSTTILATSYVKPTQWWKTQWGQEYLQENFNAVGRGVKIERIYIFADDKELEENKELLELQQKNGIVTNYAFAKDVSDVIRDDIIIIGDKICGTLLLKDREMSEVIFYSDADEIKNHKDKYEKLKKVAKPYKQSK